MLGITGKSGTHPGGGDVVAILTEVKDAVDVAVRKPVNRYD